MHQNKRTLLLEGLLMYFSELIEILKKHVAVQDLSTQKAPAIREVRLLDGSEDICEEDILYFAYDFGEDPPLQGFLFGGADIKGERHCFARFPEDRLFSVYNLTLQALREREVPDLYQEFKDLAHQAKDFESFINALALRLDNPLILIDADYRVVASSNCPPVKEALWARIIQRGYCLYPLIKASEASPPFRLGQRSREAYIGEICQHTPSPKIYSKIFFNGRYWGAIILIEESSPLSAVHYENLPKISRLLEEILPRLLRATSPEGRPVDQAFYRLLVGANPEDLAHSNELLAKGEIHRIAVLKARGKEEKIAPPMAKIRRYFPSAPLAQIQDQAVLFLSYAKEKPSFPQTLKKLEDLASEQQLFVGLSHGFEDLNRVSDYFRQGQMALETPTPEPVNSYEQVFFLALLQEFQRRSEKDFSWENYLHPSLEILLSYDKNNQSQLYRTLEVYLESEASVQKTAKRLYLHRNTVSYRLHRITKLCQVDLGNSQTRFLLTVSFQIRSYIDQGLLNREIES